MMTADAIDGDVSAIDQHLALVLRDEAGKDLERGGLASAVGPDVTEHFALGDVERHTAEHWLTVVALGQPLDPDERLCHGKPLRPCEPSAAGRAAADQRSR